MERNIFTQLIGAMIALLLSVPAFAAEIEVHNTPERIGNNWGSSAQDIIIGPQARLVVDADWFITAKNIYIHPDAEITGNGTIHLMNPATYFGAAPAATLLDAGGIAIGCKISLENNQTIILSFIDPSVTYPALGITDSHATGTDNLVMSNNLNFGNASAHLILNNSDLVFTAANAASFTYADLNTAGFAQDPAPAPANQAYVVTNGPASGIITKQGLPAGNSFAYPVGQSGPLAVPYDYTPASITNTNGIAHNFSVRVQNYSNSAANEIKVAAGMDRTWQITSDDSIPADITLTHNDVTGNNIGTDGISFNPYAAYITQYIQGNNWSVSGITYNGGSPVNVLSGTFTIPTGGDRSYFSKTSDTVYSLPVNLVSFNAEKDGSAAEKAVRLTWQTANEKNSDYFEVMRSIDGQSFNYTVCRVAAAGQSSALLNYTGYDRYPVSGDNLYRLKMVDKSGVVTWSEVRKVHFDMKDEELIRLLPNPVISNAKLLVNTHSSQHLFYGIVNAAGRLVLESSLQAEAGEHTYDLGNLEFLAQGEYYLKVQGSSLKAAIKFTKL